MVYIRFSFRIRRRRWRRFESLGWRRKRKKEALYYVIDHYGWVMKTVVKRQMGTLPHLWDDCMNDTLLAVWDHIDSFDPKRSTFQNWLASVCRFKALTYVHRWSRGKGIAAFMRIMRW